MPDAIPVMGTGVASGSDVDPDTGPDALPLSGFVSAVEAAVVLGINERTIRRAIARGELAAVKHGRAFRIARESLLAFDRDRARRSVREAPPLSVLHLVSGPGGPAFVLPRPLTSFFGRERELAAAERLLRQPEVRLMTLTGPGGAGKTRFALRLAAPLTTSFPDGIAFVSLAPVAQPELVLPTIAQGLGVREGGERPLGERLALAVGERRMLLMLDNFEHLLPAAAAIGHLLQACPCLTVLVTSRVRLRLSGEHVVPVPPLVLPGSDAANLEEIGQAEAVRLFVTRAEAVAPGFRLSVEDAPVVAEICRRLDGLPLALELAAAWTPLLPPRALLAHLDRGLTLLTGRPADAPPRLRSLREAIAWSFDLLSPAAQRLFARLSVFAGDFSLEAVVAVVGGEETGGEVLAELARLADASLIRPAAGGDQPRFAMLETIRECARERLLADGREVETRDRHLAWAIGFVETIWPPRAPAPDDFAALPRLDRERDNIRAALGWTIANRDAANALRLASAMAEYWVLRGDFTEGLAWLRQALLLDGGPPHLRAAALYGVSEMTDNRGELAAALVAAEASLDLARRHGDAMDELRARFVASGLAHRLGKPAEGAVHVAEALRLANELGAANWLGYALIVQGYESLRRGDATRAVASFADAIGAFLRAADPFGEINASYGLALALATRGERPRSVALYRRIIAVSQELAAPWGIMRGLDGLAAIGVTAGHAAEAACLVGAAEALGTALGVTLNPEGAALREETVRRTRAKLGGERFTAARQAGRGLGLEAAIAEALALADTLETGGGAESRPPSPAGLTARERDVLRLLAAGYANPQIAAALSISRGTVKTHVAHILAKLESPSRMAAVAEAHRLGLLRPGDSAS